MHLFFSGDLCKAENLTSPYAVDCASYKYDLQQTLWPDHCVINTTDAEFNPKLTFKPTDVVVRKGYKCHVSILSFALYYSPQQNTESFGGFLRMRK